MLFLNLSFAQTTKVMTYNIRYDNPNDGENNWHHRKETIVNQILFYEPDVIGTQEGLEGQIKYLNEKLINYSFVGVARGDVKEGGKGEYSAILYNKLKYKEVKSGTFWLSTTPDKPSRGWDASLNRICTYILLKNKNNKKEFWVFNTHFDHKGKVAREKSAALILTRIKEINKENLPFFLVGDFNLVPEDSPIQLISSELNDALKITQNPPFGPYGTFIGFDKCKSAKRRIDYIFTSKKNIAIKKYAVLADINNLKFPSDHFPVMIEALINP